VFAQTRRAGIATVILWLFIEGPPSKLRGMLSLLRFKYKSVTRHAKLATQQAVAQTASQSRSEKQETSNILFGVI
jgi:hypothetical protein